MTTAATSTTVIEPLDTSKHDRAAFSCGVAQVDNFFKRTAKKLAAAGSSRVWVMADEDGSIIGFYALNAHAMRYEDLPAKYARDRPSNGTIPAAYISIIGVDARRQGQGHGGVLLVDALKRLAKASRDLGLAVIMLDVLDCGDTERTASRKQLYESYGFIPLPGQELKLFMPMAVAAAL